MSIILLKVACANENLAWFVLGHERDLLVCCTRAVGSARVTGLRFGGHFVPRLLLWNNNSSKPDGDLYQMEAKQDSSPSHLVGNGCGGAREQPISYVTSRSRVIDPAPSSRHSKLKGAHL